MEKNIGKVVQIIGPVLDIKFDSGHLPNLLNAIEIMHDGRKVVCEVATQLGDDVVRCIAMSSTDGMSRGMDAYDTGTGITVPVGKATLGRIFNLLGEAIDNQQIEIIKAIDAENFGNNLRNNYVITQNWKIIK